ncbi:MAG: hypothetical protein PHS54_03005 [Clostridia bacterium]|nr:hypothetical protein [Clostridia bacterium]
MSLEKDTVIKLEEIEKRMHSLNKKLTTINDNLSLNLTNLQEYVENTETFNTFEVKSFDQGKRGYNYISFDKIFFLCKKGCLTKMNITVNARFFSTGATYTATLYMMSNTSILSNAFYTSSVDFSEETEHTFNYEYYFYPTREDNYIYIRINCSNSDANNSNLEIININIDATGRNILFLNRKNDFRVYITKDYYYITKNTFDGGYYLKAPSIGVDLTSSFTQIPNLIPANVAIYNNRYYSFNYTYMPKINYNSLTEKYEIDDTVDFFVFCVNTSGLITSGIANPPIGVPSLINWTSRGWVYSVGHPGNYDEEPRNLAIVYSASSNRPGLMNSDTYTSSSVFLTLNGIAISNHWVSNVPVFAKDWEDNPGNPYMCVATNKWGENYFYNAREATYSVALGKGIQTNAYLQTDGSINVYMRWLDKVYKKILIFNTSTSQYELSQTVTEYDNSWEILEGYSNDYFICNNNGGWSYVSAT